MNFRAALHNVLRTAPYDQPARRGTPNYEFLIAERPEQDRLVISDAGRAPEMAPDRAPDDLRERNSMFGTLISRDTQSGSETFILNRFAPPELALQGTFFPADGFAVLSFENGKPRLQAAGCHSHYYQLINGNRLIFDQPGQAANSSTAFTWHLDASWLAWTPQILPTTS